MSIDKRRQCLCWPIARGGWRHSRWQEIYPAICLGVWLRAGQHNASTASITAIGYYCPVPFARGQYPFSNVAKDGGSTLCLVYFFSLSGVPRQHTHVGNRRVKRSSERAGMQRSSAIPFSDLCFVCPNCLGGNSGQQHHRGEDGQCTDDTSRDHLPGIGSYHWGVWGG